MHRMTKKFKHGGKAGLHRQRANGPQPQWETVRNNTDWQKTLF